MTEPFTGCITATSSPPGRGQGWVPPARHGAAPFTTRAITISIALAVSLVLLAGCGTMSSKPRRTVKVTLTSSRTVTVDGQTIPTMQLTRKLKSLGATGRTGIIVAVPENTPPLALKSITSQLASAGFNRIAFSKPTRAQAATKF